MVCGGMGVAPVCGLCWSIGMEVSWFAAVWGSGSMGVVLLSEGGGVGHRWWVLVKCVVPRERDDVDVVLVRRDREVSLDEIEGFEVILQEVATGSQSWVGLTLEVGAVLFYGLEIVFEVLSLVFGVIEGDVVAERTVEVNGGGFLLKDHEHDVGGG